MKYKNIFGEESSAGTPFRATATQRKGGLKTKSKIFMAMVLLAGFLPQSRAVLFLGSADSFAVLGNTTVTSTGNTVLNGNVGVYPGLAMTGFTFSPTPGPGIVNGTTYAGGSVAQQAQADALTAYNTLAGEPVDFNLTGQDLGGLTLTAGVNRFNSSASLTGILTLDAQNNSNARFDFLIGSTLTTGSGTSVLLINGAQANNVYWQVGSSATLGTGTSFFGSILADQSITLNTGAGLYGRALALNAAVTLDNNAITVVPEPASIWVLAFIASAWGLNKSLTGRQRT